MESSAYTDVTLNIVELLWQQGYRNIGVVLQADLYRTVADEERISALGARVRLVKGAYRESKAVAYQKKADVDAQFAALTRRLLERGHDPAIATHDIAMINVALCALHKASASCSIGLRDCFPTFSVNSRSRCW